MKERISPLVHRKPNQVREFIRLDMLWERYPQYHEKKRFSSLEALLEEHESYQEDWDEELEKEYRDNGYEQFLVQLSWNDLPYRYETRKLIEEDGELAPNPYVEAFLSQFADYPEDIYACFIFPESYTSHFFVIEEVCKRAEVFHPIRNLFPDEKQIHFLAVFDKRHMEDVLLMYHLLYTNTSEDLAGGYSLYDYSFPWYQNHLRQKGKEGENVVLRSPYLPDRLARYQGGLPFCHNPAKTVYVRRNIDHMLACGYFSSELDLFRNLTERLMPYFQWWYQDLAWYEEKDGWKTNWKLERTRIRTKLTAEGVINPKWKHELSLFKEIRKLYPDTLYQYRPEWLGRQSLDLYIPSLKTAIEYQGVQHYLAVEFFGGEEALLKRQELDQMKREKCQENQVRLIEWPYEMSPTEENITEVVSLNGETRCVQ